MRRLTWLGLLLCGCQGGGAAATLSSRVQTGAAQGGSTAQAPLLGQSTRASLTSLQYSIRNISICESLVTSGAAWSQPQNCLSLFDRPADPGFDTDPSADLRPMAALARGSTGHFVDLLDETSRATLATSTLLSAADAHDYSWGLVTWDLPIKLRAEIPMSDGSTLRTHDGQTLRHTVTGGDAWYQTVAGTALDTGTTDTAVILLPTGGSWFRFQRPLTISAAELSPGSQLSLELAFDPDGLVKGSSATGAPGTAPLIDPDGRLVDVPALELSPVPHLAAQTVLRETWVGRVSSSSAKGTDDFDLRLELYSVAQDASGTILAVSLSTLVNAHTPRAFPQAPRVASSTAAGAGLDLADWSQAPILSGFVRSGNTATATLHCGGNSLRLAGCGEDGTAGSMELSFTLLATGAM
jgi:hypothetical protein